MATPDLAERFLAPRGWATRHFTNEQTGHNLRFGIVRPENTAPKGFVTILPGLSEFCEKYFETMRDLLARGFAVGCIDWQYQGHSGRLNDYPQRRHSDGFDSDLSDLHAWITHHIKPASEDLPLIMLGHSMGGKIGLRHLSSYQGIYNAAAFSAPFLGIHWMTWLEGLLIKIANNPDYRHRYIPGGSDWFEGKRKGDGRDKLTSDPDRDKIHGAWSLADPGLQLGEPTIAWIGESIKSFASIRSAGALEQIDIPVLFAMAQKEKVVSNAQILRAAARVPEGRLIVIPGAKHEILMETDARRNQFFSAFDKLLEDYKIVP